MTIYQQTSVWGRPISRKELEPGTQVELYRMSGAQAYALAPVISEEVFVTSKTGVRYMFNDKTDGKMKGDALEGQEVNDAKLTMKSFGMLFGIKTQIIYEADGN